MDESILFALCPAHSPLLVPQSSILSHSWGPLQTPQLGIDQQRQFGVSPEQLELSLWLVVWGKVVCVKKRREEKQYLEIGDGVGDGEPGSPGVLLVAKWAIESLGNGTEVEGADSRCGNAVSERQEMADAAPAPIGLSTLLKPHSQLSRHGLAQLQG